MHKLIVANFKMNGDKSTYLSLQKKLNNIKVSDTEIILCPPFLYLPFFKKSKVFALGAQDITNALNHKSTGQISPYMLDEFGVKYVIIGHSERREIGDSDEMIANKLAISVDNGIIPIVCVGEKKKTDNIDIVAKQTKSALTNYNSGEVIFAYEPVWAIETGELPDLSRIERAVAIIKRNAHEFGLNPLVLYGGSVSANNFKQLLTTNVDGLLCGSVALDNNEFIELIKGIDNE